MGNIRLLPDQTLRKGAWESDYLGRQSFEITIAVGRAIVLPDTTLTSSHTQSLGILNMLPHLLPCLLHQNQMLGIALLPQV